MLKILKFYSLKQSSNDNKILIHVYYAALNIRDVVLASGKMPLDEIFENRVEKVSVNQKFMIMFWIHL